MKNLDGIEGLIFDVDGTLVDSNDQHAYAFRDAFLKLGWNIPFSTIRPLIGMGSDKLIPAVMGKTPTKEEQQEIEETKSKMFMNHYIDRVKPFSKSQELLNLLSERGVQLVVRSSAGKEELENLLKIAGVKKLLDGIASADDAKNSKPDPDIILAAQRKLKLSSKKILMVGDTPYDIAAAEKAGIRSVAFRTGGWNDANLSRAIKIFDGPWEWFKEEKIRSSSAA